MSLSGASWKKILLFGTPALIAAIAGIHYLYSSRKGRKRTETSDEILPRKDRPVAEVPSQTPLDAAIALKNRGNKNFKAGRYAKAIECYTEALEQCPPSAINERATFYQNRAAAQENLHQYEKAIEDCTAALELSPKYLKALNRRAHLYEKIDDLQNCLFDVTACCMLERFQNGSPVQKSICPLQSGIWPNGLAATN
uniref:TPR_REGION domain-containing protein n=1 Tax=Mesocestoides corti TaxID=53468 RepID=A0A5K3F028_MESCO